MGQPRRRPGPLAPHRFAGSHARRSRKPLGRPRTRPARFARAIATVARSSRAARPGVGRGLPGPAGPGRVGRSPGRPARRSVQDRLAQAGLGLAAAGQPGPRHGRDRRGTQRPEPATRRGAARIFAYQFQGMDTRLDAGRVADRAHPRPGFVDATPGPADLAPVVLSHQRHGARPPDRRHLPRADGRARSCRSSART